MRLRKYLRSKWYKPPLDSRMWGQSRLTRWSYGLLVVPGVWHKCKDVSIGMYGQITRSH